MIRCLPSTTALKYMVAVGILSIAMYSCDGSKSKTPNEAVILTEAQVQELTDEAHTTALVLDAHADVALPNTSPIYLAADGSSKVSLDKLQKGGVNAIVMSIAADPGSLSRSAEAEARAQAKLKLTTTLDQISNNEEIVLATSKSEIEQAHKDGKIAFILGFQNARALEKNINVIDSFYNAGVRIFALTHLGHNDFADSSRPAYDNVRKLYETSRNNGLSDLGRKAIRRINELGALLDVSQLSRTASVQALKQSTSPVIPSHSNVRSISKVSRNMSDQEIDLIAQNGGVIHLSPFRAYIKDYSSKTLVDSIKVVRRSFGLTEIYSYPFELYWEIQSPKRKMAFLKTMSDVIGPVYVAEFVDHIDYIVDRVGIDHVGIGSDFNHGSGITGYSDASESKTVTEELVRRGYSTEDIQKIWSGNFLRVLEQAEDGAIQ